MKAEVEQQQAGGASDKSPLEHALVSFVDTADKDLSKGRIGEEREWLEDALFYQRRQWLEWDDGKKKWNLLKQDKKKPRPMPVSNYFAKTINANANSLGIPQMSVTPHDDSPDNRRAAQFAQRAIDAIDRESGMKVLNPLLAKHTALWGIGVTKDTMDVTASNGVVSLASYEVATTTMLGCFDCGGSSDIGPQEPPAEGMEQPQVPCPQCGSATTVAYPKDQAVVSETKQFAKGKITTEVRPIFEIFLPRDCQNPNLAKRILQKYRKPLSVVKRLFGERASDIKADDKSETHESYLEALRSLVNYNYLHENTQESVTIKELWLDWDEVPEKLQQAIENAVGQAGQEDVSEEGEPTAGICEQMEQYGLFIITAGEKLLDFGVNPYYDEDTGERYFPFTFYLWEVDPASVYSKGAGSDLKPLQKRLNRIDSLIELGMMTNAAGKWLWPKSQTTEPPSGDPSDVAEYDVVGSDKVKPEFIQPSPFHGSVWQLRATILEDFEQLGLTAGVSQGDAQGVKAFRAIAYLGAKQAEQLTTQRYLWESGHALRYRKCLIIAKRFWDDERKVRIGNYNGRYTVQSMARDDLKGSYDVDFVQDSSRPVLLSDKIDIVSMWMQAGMLDPADPETRQYLASITNMQGLNFANELQFQKAERDLERLKSGEIPMESPYQKWDIFLKVFANYTLTEEFETLDPNTQSLILTYTELMNLKMSQASTFGMTGMPVAGAPSEQAAQVASTLQAAAGSPGKAPGKQLSGVPGQSVSPKRAEGAAQAEGKQVAAQSA
jgi:hypothetical protein